MSLFSPSSTSISTPSSLAAGFSETGQATSVNVNLTGRTKIGKGGTLAPVIHLTDQGAIAAAQELASQSFRSIELLGSNLTGALAGFATELRAQGNDAIAAVSEANRTELENIGLTAIKWGALVAGGFLLVRVLLVKA